VSLRARLTLALVAVVAVGLLVSDVATYAALRSYLLHRIDQQLRDAVSVVPFVIRTDVDGGQQGQPPGPTLPPGTYVAIQDAAGHRVSKVLGYSSATDSPPVLPATLPGAGAQTAFTAAAADGSIRYRVLAETTQDAGATVIVGVPLSEVTGTLHRMGAIALIVTLGLLGLLALVAWWLVRRGLQPLERIGATADAIAGGDLSERVTETDPRTETGRLGIALNAMLGRIEGAMDEQKASEEALRRFLADASHELRTPLTSIRGYSELFRRGASADPEDTAVSMRRIEQEAERMGMMVEDLLFLARAGQGGDLRPIERAPVDLVRVAADAVRDAHVVDPDRPVGLDAPERLIVNGDESRLRQVAANLLSNAIAHTPEGTPVRVRVADEGVDAVLEVADEGPGLSEEAASQIFEPFFRADPARGRGHGSGGAGLGLAIVEAIAASHGGTAGVTSAPGAGATFTVRLPVAGPSPA
jgi:two-component system OmpR family sensor kinase